MNCLLLMTETFLIIWIKMSKNVFLKKAIIYFRSVTENRMLHMRQFIMTKEHHICIWGLFQCVMENYKEKMYSIVKNYYGYKINLQSICKKKVLIKSVAQKVLIGSIWKLGNLKNICLKKILIRLKKN